MEKLTGHWKKLVSDPKFLGAADLEGGPEIGVTVDYVTEEMVKSDRGTAPKTVVHEVIEEGEEKVQPMTGTEFQEKAMRTAATSDSDKLLLNGVMGLNGESGECIDVLKKHLFQGHELDKKKLMDELSDVLWYAAVTASGLGVSLDEVMQHNVEKLKKRYPNGFDKERSIHREE